MRASVLSPGRIIAALALLAQGSVAVTAQEEQGHVVAAGSAVIFDNFTATGSLNPAGATPASQADSAFPLDAGAADDFVLVTSPLCQWAITGVRWTGKYWSGASPGDITGFRIIFWDNEGDVPHGGGVLTPNLAEAVAVFDISGSAGETASSSGAPDAFDYQASLPNSLALMSGTRYWIEIQAVSACPPQWGMHITNTRQGFGPVQYFDLLMLPAWTLVPDAGDLAFQLLGVPQDIDCDDADPCTTDACSNGACVFIPITCDDGNSCTTDVCVNGECVAEPIPCDDENACTTDSCSNGLCVFAPVVCDDADSCTTDACVNGECVAVPIACDDESACTADSCSNGSCIFAPITCDDGNACTSETCDPQLGCDVHPLDCSDSDPCTTDVCEGGECLHLGPPDFDGDGDVDLTDFTALDGCVMGSDKTLPESCGCSDLNNDSRIDLLDLAAFQQIFSGSK